MARPSLSLKARALRYLSSREHSRLELKRKLQRHAVDTDDVEALLDGLEAAKWLSQSRFCDSLINRRARLFGNTRIMAELHSHGIDSAALGDVKAALAEGEVARASEVWQRKFGKEGIDAAARAKQIRFMLQRGFSHQAIRQAMRSAVQEDDFPGDDADGAP